MKAIGAISWLGLAMALTWPAAPTAQPATPPSIEPEALEAMDQMSAVLDGLSAFSFKADVTTEEVLEDGQKIQFGGTVDIAVRKPDRFKIVAEADTVSREYYYDGRSLTVFAPRLGYYASVAAPATIAQTLDRAESEYGIQLPLVDMFAWSTDPAMRARIRSGYALRPETIGDRTCFHYAFRQEGTDWQIWIDEGPSGLPCKLVITNTQDPSLPQYSAVLHWNVQAQPAPASFVFSPPAEAHRITLADIREGGAQ